MKTFMTLMVLMNFSLSASAASRADCAGMNSQTFGDEYNTCLSIDVSARASAGVDCIDCMNAKAQGNGQADVQANPWVQALGIIAQPLAYFGANYMSAKYANKTQEAWANAYSSGNEQCTSRFNSYLNYNTQIAANPITSSEAQSFASSCNGNSLGAYAGYGGLSSNGYGGFGNPFLSAGYSSGMLNGMVGTNFGLTGTTGTTGFGSGLGVSLGSNLSNMMGYGLDGATGLGGIGLTGTLSMTSGMNYPSGVGLGMGSYPYGINSGYGASIYGPGMSAGAAGVGVSGYANNGGYWGNTGGAYGSSGYGVSGMGTNYYNQYQTQLDQQMALQGQAAAGYARLQGNANVNQLANTALYQNYSNAQTDMYGLSGVSNYGASAYSTGNLSGQYSVSGGISAGFGF